MRHIAVVSARAPAAECDAVPAAGIMHSGKSYKMGNNKRTAASAVLLMHKENPASLTRGSFFFHMDDKLHCKMYVIDIAVYTKPCSIIA